MRQSFELTWKKIGIILILLLAAGAVFCIYKYSDHVSTVIDDTSTEQAVPSEQISENGVVIQEFIPQHSNLEAIGLRLYLSEVTNAEGGLYLSVLSPDSSEIAHASTLISMMPENGYYYFQLNLTVIPGEHYYMMLYADDVGEESIQLASYDTAAYTSDTNGFYTSGGVLIENRALVTAYQYQVVVSKNLISTMIWIVSIGTIAALILLSCMFRRNRDRVVCVLDRNTLNRIIACAKKQKTKILFGTIVVFALIYLSLIFNDNIWTDEAYTIDLLRNCHTIREVFEFTAQDVHPPMYYVILLPFSNLFGINLQVLKVLSIIPMILTFVIGAVWIRKLFHCRTALLFILFLGSMPVTMEYAVQVRMYSWALLFVTICALSAYEAYRTEKIRYFVFMGLTGTACAYTHYFAFASALWIYGFLFIALLCTREKRKNLITWVCMSAGSAVLYLPWIKSMYGQISGVTGSYWIGAVTKKVVLSYFGAFFETDLPYVKYLLQILSVIMICMMFFHMIRSLREKKREDCAKYVFVCLSFLVMLLTIATGVVLSRAIRPIFIIRYAIPCLGLLSLFFAYAVSRVGDRIYLCIVLFCICLGIIDYEDTHAQEYESTTVPQMEAFFDENLSEGDIVAYNYKTFDFIYQYYFNEEQLMYLEDIDFASEYHTIWYLDTAYNPEITTEQITQYGLNISFVGNYNIEHNAFAIYRISR